jgi:hypothetical protein
MQAGIFRYEDSPHFTGVLVNGNKMLVLFFVGRLLS